MKRLTLLFAGLLFTGVVIAQQKPQYTQYIINNYIVNPAITGIENYTDVKLSHRHQWVGFNDAPVTSYLTLHAPIGKKDYKTNVTTQFQMQGSNPLGKEYWDEYEASPAHHGVGMQIVNDKAGYFTNFSMKASYAYHMPITKRTNLSAGIAMGISKFSLNSDKTFWGDADPDPSVYQSGIIGKTKFDVDAGVWLYSADYFVGVSALQLMPQKVDFSADGNVARTSEGKFVPHLFVTAGYRFLFAEDFNFIPSIMIKNISPLPTQIDINAKVMYQDIIWAGASYRSKYGYAAMVGFKPVNRFLISYSYDYSTTQLKTVSSGTHEIVLGFMLGGKYNDDTCPKNVW